MGTKVQYTGNLPGILKMRDLNEDANDCWPQQYNEESSECMRNAYHLRKAHDYVKYDKEMFKRTMLEHEAIFRKQVYELHRLYGIQKNMMNDMKADASNSYSSSSQFPFLGASKSVPLASSLANNYIKPPLCFQNGSSSYKELDVLNCNHKSLPIRVSDLQLPASTYLDRKELEIPQKEIIAESSSVTTHALNSHSTHSLSDLNETAKEMWLSGKQYSLFHDKMLSGSQTSVAYNHCVNFPIRSDTSFSGLPNASLQRKHCDVGSSSNSLINEAAVANKISSSMESFSALSKEKSPIPYGLVQRSQKRCENLSWNLNRSDMWYKPKYESSSKVPLFGYTSPAPNYSKSLLAYNGTSSHQNGFYDPKPEVSPVPPFYQNGFNHGTGLDLNSKNDINCEAFVPHKLDKDMHLNNGFLNGFQKCLTTKKDDETECLSLSWLRRKPASKTSCIMELDLSQGYPQLKTVINNPKHDKIQEEAENNSSSVQVSSSQLNNMTTKSNKIFGFHITEKPQQSNELSSRQGEVFQTKEVSVRNQIDLNIDLNSSDITTELAKVESGLDLEVPIIDAEVENNNKTLVIQAAESILLLSSHECTRLDILPHDSFDALHLFAKIVSSNVQILEVNYQEEAMDSFEQMTLDLGECKPDELLSWDKFDNEEENEDEDNGKRNKGLLVCTKPRRGQPRKRRKKDFRKEILPGLASLSRKEVSEDLQSIGVTTTKRRAGRKPKKVDSKNSVNTLQVNSPPQNNSNKVKGKDEIQIEGINLIGWGRTTRRCRRQRFMPITNATTALT